MFARLIFTFFWTIECFVRQSNTKRNLYKQINSSICFPGKPFDKNSINVCRFVSTRFNNCLLIDGLTTKHRAFSARMQQVNKERVSSKCTNKRNESNYISSCERNCGMTTIHIVTINGAHNKSGAIVFVKRVWEPKLYQAALRNDIQDSLGCLCLHYPLICEVKLWCIWREHNAGPYLPPFPTERGDDGQDLFCVMKTVRVKQDACWQCRYT